MSSMPLVLSLLWMLLGGGFLGVSNGAKILGLFPYHGLSHYMVFQPLLIELAERGHNVTVISHHPLRHNVPANFRNVDVSSAIEKYTNNVAIRSPMYGNILVQLQGLYRHFDEDDAVLGSDGMKEFLRSGEQFDLVLTEYFVSRIYFAFPYVSRTPIVALSSCRPLVWVSYDIGNPINPSYIANALGVSADGMNFLERLQNAVEVAITLILFETIFEWKASRIMRKHFGDDLPAPRTLAKNISLTLLPGYPGAFLPRPTLPSAIEVGGMYIGQAKKLPQDIETFINESEHGVVYFCMGSLLRGSSFPEEKRNAFLYAFSKIPQRVLWKWEGDELPGKSDKIMTSKWMPQRDILAHPKVKLFISHGGLLGTNEAVYEGVPILGIPIFGDQRTNVRSIEASGAGEMLDYNEISNEVVLEKIQRLINYPKYRENAEQLSRRYRDRPMPPLDTAVYWTEYVIRHKGAPHLRSPAVDMPWYQYLLLDVIAFVIFVLVATLVVIYYVLKFTLRILLRILFRIFTRKPNVSKTSKKVD